MAAVCPAYIGPQTAEFFSRIFLSDSSSSSQFFSRGFSPPPPPAAPAHGGTDGLASLLLYSPGGFTHTEREKGKWRLVVPTDFLREGGGGDARGVSHSGVGGAPRGTAPGASFMVESRGSSSIVGPRDLLTGGLLEWGQTFYVVASGASFKEHQGLPS